MMLEDAGSEESCPKTLYVGHLDMSVTEELLCTLFAQIGPVMSCKIIREPSNDPYAFVEFCNHQAASTALIALNKRVFLNKEMKVNWATSAGNQPKQDTSKHHHIFVGDLSPEVETKALREAFAPFGEISTCRIVRDPQTLKSKGYAFVSFVKKAEAEQAIQVMNGQWIGSRSIRTNWSTRKPPPPRTMIQSSKQPTFDEVYNQSSDTNCTVYCGGCTSMITEDLIHKTFMPFGNIVDIRVFKDKGYAFIKFQTKYMAARAIEAINQTRINGQLVKCCWGKENGGVSSASAASAVSATDVVAAAAAAAAGAGTQAQPTYAYGYGGGNYWYQGYGPGSGYVQNFPAAAAATYQQQQQYQYPGGAAGAAAAAAVAAAAGQQYCMVQQPQQQAAQQWGALSQSPPQQANNVPLIYSTLQKYPTQ